VAHVKTIINQQKARKQHTPEFRSEALRPAERIGVAAAVGRTGRGTGHSPKGQAILCEAPEMKYVFIEKHQAEFSIKSMCQVLRVARSGWYAWHLRRHQIRPRQ